VFSDADAAALYDLLYPWDGERWPADAFYDKLVMKAGSVLDVGCGTGSMLHCARDRGHAGRLVGLDPDGAALARARRRRDIEWVEGKAVQARWRDEFELVTMTGHAFQCLITDDELRQSLAAIAAALAAGGQFAFETRHPQARAWEGWTPSNVTQVTGDGMSLLVWHEVESVSGDVVCFTETTAGSDGTVLRIDRACLRFLGAAALDGLLAGAGLEARARFGDWDGGPVTGASREIITIARRRRSRD
jgi:SAM-dependent methyltransferase